MSEKLSTATKFKMISAAVSYFLTSCATPAKSSPETRQPTGRVIAVCPDTTDPKHRNLLRFEFYKLPPGADGTIKIEYDITPIPGDGSTDYTPPRRLNRPGNVPTKEVFLDIPFALVTDTKTGQQNIATVNLSQCVTEDSEAFSEFFKDIKPNQIYPPGQQASFNGKPLAFGKEAQARRQMTYNPYKGRTRVEGKAGPIFRRG